MFADKGYEGWDKLSPYQKVERVMEIHKSGHEGEDVSFLHISSYQQKHHCLIDHFRHELLLHNLGKRRRIYSVPTLHASIQSSLYYTDISILLALLFDSV